MGRRGSWFKDGDAGFLVNPEDIEAMYMHMKFFADNPDEIPMFAERAYQLGQSLDLSVGVERFLNILRDALANSPNRRQG